MKYLIGALVLIAALAHRASAYPQFQLSRDQTCSSCHLSPAGGGILGENGLEVAGTMATYDVSPEPLHGALSTPSWLLYSGDVRFGAGLIAQQGAHPGAFPMQGELDFAARGDGFTAYATLGAQAGTGQRPLTFLLLREHFLMWQPDPGATDGLYVRVGRFMPVYGLRFAEHNFYVEQDGQTPLYGETYGAAVEYVQSAWEVHATAFVADPLQDPIERGDGGAVYGEARVGHSSFGVEGRYAKAPEEARLAGGVTAKQWIPAANLLLELEGQLIRQTFDAGGKRKQIVSELLGSWFFRDGWMLDVGVGQFDEDLALAKTDYEALDVNLHWFTTSHWELMVTNRVQTLTAGSGGPTSGYSLVQIHYRL